MIKDQKNHKKLRDVVKKVIAFQTQGIDVSALFSEMCMLSYTPDIITKKMIYLYLINYAETNSDLALMAINSFTKDCKNENPTIRACALRSLCSLRFNGAIEYLQPQILEMLNDFDPHVRKTAIMGIIKCHHMNPSFVDDNNITDLLYNMQKDPVPSVATNAVCALNEIMIEDGGMAINSKIITYLLSRIEKYDDYGKSIIQETTSRYTPKNETEMFDIMNHLFNLQKLVRSSTILSTIKVFLKFALKDESLFEQVIDRIKAPLLTQLSSREDENETRYVVICHIMDLVDQGGAKYFMNDYKRFFCTANDPIYIQEKKLDIMVKLANDNNQTEILNELGEYATDVNATQAKKSVLALGKQGTCFPTRNSAIIKQQSAYVKIARSTLMDEIVIAFSEILSINLNDNSDILNQLEGLADQIKSEKSKISLVWILGEYGGQLDASPYILESAIDDLTEANKDNDEDENQANKSPALKLQVIFFN